MTRLAKRILIGIGAPVIAAAVFLVFSFATGFGTWPWQRHWPYSNGELGIRLGSTKAEVWTRIAELQGAAQLDTIGRNNDQRATTDAFSQVHDLDEWSFVVPPCCSCSLEFYFREWGVVGVRKALQPCARGPLT